MLRCESMVLSCSTTSLVKRRYEITNNTTSSGSAVSLRLRLVAAFAMASIFQSPGRASSKRRRRESRFRAECGHNCMLLISKDLEGFEGLPHTAPTATRCTLRVTTCVTAVSCEGPKERLLTGVELKIYFALLRPSKIAIGQPSQPPIAFKYGFFYSY